MAVDGSVLLEIDHSKHTAKEHSFATYSLKYEHLTVYFSQSPPIESEFDRPKGENL